MASHDYTPEQGSMRVLFLSPQPFYQERGTPIAVKIAVESLAKRLIDTSSPRPAIDLLCYAEGEDILIPGTRIIRIPSPSFLRGITPGISFKKLLCDIVFFFTALRLIRENRHNQYSVIHAVEESVFIAWFIKKLWGIPYVYDMDSSLSMQVTEKWWWSKPLFPILRFLEGIAVRGSVAVAPVCDALLTIAEQHGSRHTVMLRDVSLLPTSTTPPDDRSRYIGRPLEHSQPVILYVGNLESYQGIDLLIDSFSLARHHPSKPHLVIVGGTSASIEHYRSKAAQLGALEQVSFLGPRPVAELGQYLQLADILVSPRIKGNNTPMKIYSYLHSGRALLATDLPTHRQVLDDEIAVLASPTPEGFANGITSLLQDPERRARIGSSARERAEKLYTLSAFESQLHSLYDEVARNVQRKVEARATPVQEGA